MGSKKAWTTVVLACVLLAASTAAADPDVGLSLDGLWLTRDTENVPLGVLDGRVVLETKDADPGWAPGLRGSIQIPCTEGLLEIAGMNVRHSGDRRLPATPPTGDYDAFFDPDSTGTFVSAGGFQNAEWYRIDYRTRLSGLELNYIRPLNQHLTVLCGVQATELREHLDFFSFDDAVDRGDLDVKTRNRMLGAQVGAKATLPVLERVSLDVGAKGGVYANWARKNLSYYETQDGTSFSDSDSRLRPAYLLEANAGLTWRLLEGVALHVGYVAMRLGQVGVAPDQMPTANSEAEFTKFRSGSALYHGGSVSVRVEF